MSPELKNLSDLVGSNPEDNKINITIQSDKPENKKTNWLTYVLVILVLLGVAAAVHFYYQSGKLRQDLVSSQNHPQPEAQTTAAQTQDEAKQLVETVGKLIVLPSDEQPTIATVADLEKLKNQPFFADAKIGDKVLIYPKAQKAVLYRPSENKIIALAPFVVPEDTTTQTTASSSPAATSSLTIEIRNGSGKTGAANTLKTQIQSIDRNFTVTRTGNAIGVFEKTVLYVSPGNENSALAKKLSAQLGAEITSSLPAGEVTSLAQAVVFIGKQ